MVSVASQAGSGELPETVSPVELDSNGPILSALYPANGQVYARLFEADGLQGSAVLKAQNLKFRLMKVNLLNEEEGTASNPLTFNSWQFRTFRFEVLR